jgi:hypothetical protein
MIVNEDTECALAHLPYMVTTYLDFHTTSYVLIPGIALGSRQDINPKDFVK